MKGQLKKLFIFGLVALLVLPLFSFSGSAFASYDKISGELAKQIRNGGPSAIPVIVQTRQGLQEKHKAFIKNAGGNVKRNLAIIKGFSADLPAQAIADIANDEDVTGICYDYRVTTLG